MQVSVEAPNHTKRRLTVTVPQERIEQAFLQRIQMLSKTAKINGFRPGKVPLEVLKKHYGDTAREQALSEVIQKTLYSAMSDEKLSPVSVPTVEPTHILPGQPLKYIATFDILPIINEVKFDLSEIEKETAILQEENVDNVLLNLRLQQTQWNPVVRPAQEKDRVLVDFKGSLNGIPFEGGEAHDYPIVIGSKSMVPGFEEGITGMGAGEEKTITVVFPENYFSKEVAGKKTEFLIKVLKVFEPELPPMDEAFVKKLGIKSGHLNELKEEIQRNLQRELSRVIQLKLKTKVFNRLVEQNPLELPDALVERETQRIHDQLHPHHGSEPHAHSEHEMAEFKKMAAHNVALGLLISALAKQYGIVADREAVKTLLETMASSYEDPKAVMNYYMKDKNKRSELEMQVLEDQVLAKLLEKVTITEKSMSYTELMNMR